MIKKSKIATISFFKFLFFTIFLAISYKSAPAFKSSHNETLLGKKTIFGNAYIIDGDSLKIGKKEIRLIGIDAPEYKQECYNKNKEKYRCGLKSKKFLISLTKGKKVTCYYDKKDYYNRFLSHCFVKNISLNKKLIENGMALIYNPLQASVEFKNLEKEAKNKKLGIWQGSFQIPKQYRKNNRRK